MVTALCGVWRQFGNYDAHPTMAQNNNMVPCEVNWMVRLLLAVEFIACCCDCEMTTIIKACLLLLAVVGIVT